MLFERQCDNATDVDAFLGAQLAWLEANVPKNGEIVPVDDYGAARLPKGATRVWAESPADMTAPRSPSTRETGRSARFISRLPSPLRRGRRPAPDDAADAPAAEPKTRPDITQKGREMLAEMRTEALVKALGREGLASETLVGLLVLALAADNVTIRPTNMSRSYRSSARSPRAAS